MPVLRRPAAPPVPLSRRLASGGLLVLALTTAPVLHAQPGAAPAARAAPAAAPAPSRAAGAVAAQVRGDPAGDERAAGEERRIAAVQRALLQRRRARRVAGAAVVGRLH